MSKNKETKQKVLVTGSKGFIGKNMVVALKRQDVEVVGIDIDSTSEDLDEGIYGADVIYHFAGINRPEREEEFIQGNVGSIETLIAALDKCHKDNPSSQRPAIILSSSAQAGLENPYGRSKAAAEKMLKEFANNSNNPAVIYRLPGVFGKWCKPNYNSVVATFCHNIARDLPITISNPDHTIELVHVDDVVIEFLKWLEERPKNLVRGNVAPTFKITLGQLEEKIRALRASRSTLAVADTSDHFTKRLLGTYTAYLPPTDLKYLLKKRSDNRGALAELLKSPRFGQIFVSRTHPGITRGNHYHDLKVEKFCVLEGDALICFRSIISSEVVEQHVSGTDFAVVDIPPGMSHTIENVGDKEMIVLFWASEIFDPDHTDTYFEKVVEE